MASLTKKLKSIRRRKRAAQGRGRKSALARKGTTPPFAIHPDKGEKAASAS